MLELQDKDDRVKLKRQISRQFPLRVICTAKKHKQGTTGAHRRDISVLCQSCRLFGGGIGKFIPEGQGKSMPKIEMQQMPRLEVRMSTVEL